MSSDGSLSQFLRKSTLSTRAVMQVVFSVSRVISSQSSGYFVPVLMEEYPEYSSSNTGCVLSI